MNSINKIYNKLRFRYYLTKKAALQKYSVNNRSYLNRKEAELNVLLNQQHVEKSDSENYFNRLSESLFDNLVSSGISLKDICQILAGKLAYVRSGYTPDKVQQVLVDNYCKTNGLFQEALFDFMYRDHEQTYIKEGASSLFGKIDVALVKTIADEVQSQGYSKLPFTLPKSAVDSIVNWSKDLTYTIIDDSLNGNFFKGKVDFNNSIYTKASAAEEDLKNNDLIMKICTDPLLLSILQTALRAEIDLWHLSMWWSFKTDKASDVAAQFFHYDLDTLRWLKIFVYLTDVGPTSGPHTAIPGSHQVGAKNYELLKKRYSRVSDQEMAEKQPGEISEFYGPAGTIIIGDTRCWHKGKEVLQGNRLILQPTFSPTYFLKRLI